MSGHRGFVPNELADGLAKLGVLNRAQLGGIGLDWDLWLAHDAAALDWLAHAAWAKSVPAMAPRFQDGLFMWGHGPAAFQSDPIECMLPFLPPEVVAPSGGAWEKRLCVQLRCASYNALSLAETARNEALAPAGLHSEPGRVSMLAASLQAEHVLVAGLQETRTKQGCARCGPFLRLCSGADESHNFGTEIWVNTQAALGVHGQTELRLGAAALVVLHEEPFPTILIVRARTGPFRATLVSAHGPHRGHDVVHRCQ